MAKGDQALLTFNRGVVSRMSLARIDLKRLAMSAEEQTNLLPRAFGPMSLRPGLEFAGLTNVDPTPAGAGGGGPGGGGPDTDPQPEPPPPEITFSNDACPIVEVAVDISQACSQEKFDSDLGTLISASLTLTGSTTADLFAADEVPGTVTARARPTLQFTSTLASLNAIVSLTSNRILLEASTPITVPGGYINVSGPTVTDSDSRTIDLASILGDLSVAGGGTLSIGCTSVTTLSVLGGEFPTVGGFVMAGFGAYITYTYAPN